METSAGTRWIIRQERVWEGEFRGARRSSGTAEKPRRAGLFLVRKAGVQAGVQAGAQGRRRDYMPPEGWTPVDLGVGAETAGAGMPECTLYSSMTDLVMSTLGLA